MKKFTLPIPGARGDSQIIHVPDEVIAQLNPYGGQALENHGINDMSLRTWNELLKAAVVAVTEGDKYTHAAIQARARFKMASSLLSSTHGQSQTWWEQCAFATVKQEETPCP